MVIISDQELLQQSVEPALDLFPVMRRAKVMSPLVVLLVMVPGLLAFHSYRIDELSAWFGLQCLGKVGLISENSSALISQPPLVRWLYTGLLSVIGHWSSSLVLFSFFSTSCMLFAAYRLARKACNARYAIVFCFLLSFHPVVINQVQLIESPAFPILFVLLTLWGFLGHIQSESGVVSYKLLCGGISLGLCLLAGGSLAIGVLIVLGIYIINPADLLSNRSSTEGKKLPVLKQAIRAWKSLVILAFTGFAVGGWWELMTASQVNGFWAKWFAGPGQPQISLYWQSEFYPTYYFRDLISTMGFLMGFALFGMLHGMKRILNPAGDQKEIAWLRLVLIWLLCGFIFWWGVQFLPQMNTSTRAMWKLFFIVPMLAIVTWEFQQIALRHVSYPTVLSVFTLGVLSVIFINASHGNTLHPQVTDVFLQQIMVLGLSLVMLLWYSHRFRKEYGHRIIEVALVLALSFLHVVSGFYSVPKPNPVGERLLHFEHQLRLTEKVDECILVSDSTPPLELTFLLFFLWDDIDLNQIQGTVLMQDLGLPEMTEPSRTTVPNLSSKKQAVVRWGVTPVALRNIVNAGFVLNPLTSPEIYKQKELQADLISTLPQNY